MCSTRQRLAALLREQREGHSLTLRQAAARAQIAASTLSRWESGACAPRVPELQSLLDVLGVVPDEALRILASLDVPRAARAVREREGTRAPSGGALLRALRRRTGRSLVEVAGRLGVAASTVSRWESSASHPSASALRSLLDLFDASEEERACLQVSGVAKLKAERPAFEPEAYAREIEAIEATSPFRDAANAELRLLQLQSLLWWFRGEPTAALLRRRAQVAYARFLGAHGRHSEMSEQAEASLRELADWGDALAVEAQRLIAWSDVYRWPTARPHLGLFTLQRALAVARDEASRAGVLTDMAQYSHLAGRIGESRGYADRAAPAGCLRAA